MYASPLYKASMTETVGALTCQCLSWDPVCNACRVLRAIFRTTFSHSPLSPDAVVKLQAIAIVDVMVPPKALACVHQHLQQQATVSACQDYFVLLTIMTLAVIPWVFFLRRRQAD
jgi:hypothetical protein